jgi:hypothetical protein
MRYARKVNLCRQRSTHICVTFGKPRARSRKRLLLDIFDDMYRMWRLAQAFANLPVAYGRGVIEKVRFLYTVSGLRHAISGE